MDGKGCGSSEIACCKHTLIPWFYKLLDDYTTNAIEMKVSCDQK